MKASDNFTVQALIVALSQIEQPLDSQIQSELNQIAADWKNDSVFNNLTPSSKIRLISPGRCTPYALSFNSGKNFSDEYILPRQEIRDSYPQYENPFVTTSDCYSCKYFSGDHLLKCVVNPTRMMDDDCNEFERAEY
jgi:hypothetical protein